MYSLVEQQKTRYDSQKFEVDAVALPHIGKSLEDSQVYFRILATYEQPSSSEQVILSLMDAEDIQKPCRLQDSADTGHESWGKSEDAHSLVSTPFILSFPYLICIDAKLSHEYSNNMTSH